jgi:enoyl-CoA hydratase/carnithine racemase
MQARSPLRVEIEPPVAWITLDRPDEGNPISDSVVDALCEAWDRLSHDDSVRAIGIGASGPAFSVGFLPGSPPIDRPFGPKSCGCTLPILVELGGDIASGAFQLIGEADVVLAAQDVVLTVPLDMAARADVLGLRPRLPESQIRRLALLGPVEPLTARLALRLGLIDELLPASSLHRRSMTKLVGLAGSPH